MKKVLLASAYLLFLKKMSTLLMKRGIQIFTSTSGEEALKLHKHHLFDLIIIDFKLEDISGVTLCAQIRKGEHSPDVPIIMTCHNLPGSIERVERSGADKTLIKPIEPIRLMETIGSFLDLQLGRSRRVVLNIRVICLKNREEFFCKSHDISNTGILLETDYPLALGSIIICQFSLPDICLIEAKGVVTRFMTTAECNDLYGVKFVALPFSARKAIDNYIASMPDTPSSSNNSGSSRNI